MYEIKGVYGGRSQKCDNKGALEGRVTRGAREEWKEHQLNT